jgi:Tol biopolymer transport system component
MQTDNDLEQRLRDVLREELDRGHGPDPTWDESPAARRVAEPERRRPQRWTIRLLAVAALITIGVGSAVLLGSPDDLPALGHNGWIAFGMHPEDGGDQDIWFVSPGREPRRVIGTETDRVDQLCPAFSPDGRSLAFGQVDQSGATPTTAVVVASVNGEGEVSEVFRVDVGGAPPCPVWSPAGDRIAFGVPQTSAINPTQSAAGSEVWILTVADRGTTVLPDLLATDLEFSPDGSVLGIASGSEYDGNFGDALADNQIHLYDLASGTIRILEGTLGSAGSFTWSPDGGRIAYQGRELRVIDLATEEERVLSAPYGTLHGIGPVWSPDGESIVYQRCLGYAVCSGERHDVVVVWPDDLSADGTPREEVVPLIERSADGSETSLTPYWVSWSPDGEYLMFVGWSGEIDPLLGVVPVGSGSPSDILVIEQDVAVHPVYDSGPFVPIQSWGRLPADAVMPTPAPSASPAESTPLPSASVGLPGSPHFLLQGTDSGESITVTIPASGWDGEPNGGVLCWGDPADTCAGPPEGAGIFAFASREYYVYEEACQWLTTRPDTPATTVDELIDALANQGSRAESAPEDVTVDGYVGKRIVLGMHPVDLDACDEGQFALFGLPGIDPARSSQDNDQVEEVWALDVNGVLVVLDGAYYPATTQNAVDELRAIISSATFD